MHEIHSVAHNLARQAIGFVFNKERDEVLRSLEILMYLAQNPNNEIVFEEADQSFFQRLSELLCMNSSGISSLESENQNNTKRNAPTWSVPWSDSSSHPGSGMGVVYGPKATVQSALASDEYVDHEVRDTAIEALYHISNYGPIIKVSDVALQGRVSHRCSLGHS